MNKAIIMRSLASALAVFAYVLLIVLFLSNAGDRFGESEELLIPVFMLLLFIISATITGLLVLAKPIHLYITGFKRDAFILLFGTLGWLMLLLIVVALVLFRTTQ
ncbi:MAG: hypothetical protein Q7S15_01865 [bacterium]|nr:hypothetical protein [bacterium]